MTEKYNVQNPHIFHNIKEWIRMTSTENKVNQKDTCMKYGKFHILSLNEWKDIKML